MKPLNRELDPGVHVPAMVTNLKKLLEIWNSGLSVVTIPENVPKSAFETEIADPVLGAVEREKSPQAVPTGRLVKNPPRLALDVRLENVMDWFSEPVPGVLTESKATDPVM